jgi:hypothetical protein
VKQLKGFRSSQWSMNFLNQYNSATCVHGIAALPFDSLLFSLCLFCLDEAV